MVQLFVRNLSARSVVVDVDACGTVAQLKTAVQERQGFASTAWTCLGLVHAGRQLRDDTLLTSCGISADSTVHLVPRVAGGKGGFGALLRGQGRDGKTTTNFDACRDLQGRRLRHSRAEQQLAEWQSQAKERELEKIAQQHIKEMARQQRKDAREQVDVDAVLAQHKQALEKVQDAVQSALAASSSGAAGPGAGAGAQGGGKRKSAADERAAAKPAAKKPRMLACLEEVEDSDEEDEESDA